MIKYTFIGETLASLLTDSLTGRYQFLDSRFKTRCIGISSIWHHLAVISELINSCDPIELRLTVVHDFVSGGGLCLLMRELLVLVLASKGRRRRDDGVVVQFYFTHIELCLTLGSEKSSEFGFRVGLRMILGLILHFVDRHLKSSAA